MPLFKKVLAIFKIHQNYSRLILFGVSKYNVVMHSKSTSITDTVGASLKLVLVSTSTSTDLQLSKS